MDKCHCSEAIKSTEWMLRITGVWPLQTTTWSYSLRRIINWSILLLELITVIRGMKDAVENGASIEEVYAMIATLFLVIICCLKIGVFTYKRGVFLLILEDLHSTRFNSHKQRYDKPLANALRIIRFLGMYFPICILMVVVFHIVFPLFGGTPLSIYPTFELENHSYISHGIQIITVALLAWNITSADLFFASMITIATAQVEILKLKLRNFPTEAEDEFLKRSTRKQSCFHTISNAFLIDCVDLHTAVIRFLQKVEKMVTFVLLIQYSTGVVIVCNTLLELCQSESIFSSDFIQPFSFLCGVLNDLVIYHWLGNEVIAKSDKIIEACSVSKWYICDSKTRKTLFVIMEKAKKPLKIDIFKFTELSFQSFIAILHAAFSVYTLLDTLA